MPRRALVVIDMINTYDHEDAERLRQSAERAVPVIGRLVERARDAGAPVIYVNDNFGQWRSDQDALVKDALAGEHASLVEPIVPDDEAMFVVKARHSIFYETPFEYLLRSQEIDDIVLTGQATEQCILYSALDAHIRHIPVLVPRDAVAHIHEDLAEAALRMMELNMEAEVVEAGEVTF
ncbi:MAG TPA: isochorismatase family cysteine hydrolase [Solirubrobacteraceae bacterium]|nr:isochorismatase family cysteine hydrolase [Solirubrobacteraceae bacterium]